MLKEFHRDAKIYIVRWSDTIVKWSLGYLGMHTLASRYKSSEFSEEDIIVFLRRVSGPEKVVGLPEVRQLAHYRVWFSLTGRLAYFPFVLSSSHTL